MKRKHRDLSRGDVAPRDGDCRNAGDEQQPLETKKARREHASRGMVPLLVNAAVPAPRPGVAPALAGIATVREVAGAINADFCILANASASISVRDVAGLDDR